MAAPYCTLTGTIPGGQNGKATVRITPDVDGATATINGTEVSMREYLVTSDSAGAIRVEILAPGNGVNPGGNWTHTVEIKTPDGVTRKHVSLTQGETIDIVAANPVRKIAPDIFFGPASRPLPLLSVGSGGSAGVATALGSLPLQPGRVVPTVGFFGDSWSTEAMMGPGFNLPAAASRLLGCVPMVSAVDGSGFAHSKEGNLSFEADSRVDAVCAAIPNLIVTVGSLNSDKVVENGDTNGTKITEAVKQFVTKVRAKLPNVPIIMVGPEPSSVSRLQSRDAHINVKAQKAGVEAAGGTANGIAFVDWLGIADKQAVPFREGRDNAEGDVVVYGGVAYRVTRAWTPAAGETPVTPGAPVVQVSDVLSGTGNEARKQNDGTRDILLMSDDTHPTKAGSTAFGSALAVRISEAYKTIEGWAKSMGPVTPAGNKPAPAQPPAPPAKPKGLPIMAWLPGGWGKTDRNAYSLDELKAVAALKPDQIALPIQSTADGNDSAVAIKQHYETGKEFSQAGLQTIRNAGVNVAGMIEALDTLEAQNIAVLPNVRNGLLDYSAQWYRSSNGKILPILLKRTGKLYFALHGRGENKMREIMKADYAGLKRVSDNTDGSADWQISSVKDAQLGVIPASAGASAWQAAKTAFPEGVWVLVANKDEQATSESSAKAAGVTIVGWAAPNPEAFAKLKA
nr:MAG TPA: lipolytic protein [Caudoviricetes sp.]